ncbi:MAG: hypothetical protein WDN69_15250 [Aliidongia sp.]
MTPATLDPRPDTETLIEAVLAQLPDRQASLRLADFGTGTGCILLAPAERAAQCLWHRPRPH